MIREKKEHLRQVKLIEKGQNEAQHELIKDIK